MSEANQKTGKIKLFFSTRTNLATRIGVTLFLIKALWVLPAAITALARVLIGLVTPSTTGAMKVDELGLFVLLYGIAPAVVSALVPALIATFYIRGKQSLGLFLAILSMFFWFIEVWLLDLDNVSLGLEYVSQTGDYLHLLTMATWLIPIVLTPIAVALLVFGRMLRKPTKQ